MSNELANFIDGSKDKFLQTMPSGMNFESEKGFAMQILLGNDYLFKVAAGNKRSLVEAVENVAAIGLSLNPAAKEAYLIPRKGKVCLDPSYMGLVKLATDSGSILWAQAGYVCANDKFTDNGPGNAIEHKYQPFVDRGEIVGFYCTAKTKEGDYLTDTMTLAEIHGIRDRSEAWKSKKAGPWKTDFTEQGKKTVVRRAFKMWPKTDHIRMAQAVEMSNSNEGFESLLTSPEIETYSPDQKAYLDQCLTNSDSLELFIFMQGLDESVKMALNHSFEKGEKGKYQRLIGSMVKDGRASVDDYIVDIRIAIDAEDDQGTLELLIELDASGRTYIASEIGAEYESDFMRLSKGLAETIAD